MERDPALVLSGESGDGSNDGNSTRDSRKEYRRGRVSTRSPPPPPLTARKSPSMSSSSSCQRLGRSLSQSAHGLRVEAYANSQLPLADLLLAEIRIRFPVATTGLRKKAVERKALPATTALLDGG
jgi:hypothetical protein